jgi:uncharacterized protein DUF2694
LTADDPTLAVEDQSFSHATPDGSVWVRVAARGHVLGVQVEPAAMRRPGHVLAEQIMACADAGYLEGQVAQREALVKLWGTDTVVEGMPTERDFAAAVARLNGM